MNISKITPKLTSEIKTNLPAIRYRVLDVPIKAVPIQLDSDLPLSNVSAKILKSLIHAETISSKTFIKERNSGVLVPVYITKFEREGKKYLNLKDENACKLGYLDMEKPQQGYFNNPIGDDYIYNSMEVTTLESVNKGCKASPYSGIGTELLKAAVLESKKSGYNGRLHLMAYNSHPPTPFYYKCGFRFLDSEKNSLMEKFLSSSASNSSINFDEPIQKGLMYLPDENIDYLLNIKF